MELKPEIFRSYDIRGIVGKDIDTDVANILGKAFGSYIQALAGSLHLAGRLKLNFVHHLQLHLS